MNTRLSFACIVCLFLRVAAYGQSVQGSVADRSSRQPIPFATIYSLTTQTGTLSNENGDFSLPVASLPARLVVSHIGYQADTITVAQSGLTSRVELKPAVHELAPVTVSNAGYKLIRQAFERIRASKNIVYGTAFYRQLTKNGGQPIELQEVMYQLKLSANQLDGVHIDNARYAKLPDDASKHYARLSNFSYLVLGQRASSDSKPTAGRVLFPMRNDVVDYYDVRLTDQIELPNGQKIAELECQIHDDYTGPAFSGTLFINTTTFNIVRLQGTIRHSLGAAVDTRNVQTKNYVYSIAIDYIDRMGTSYFNTIRVGVSFEQLIKATGVLRTNDINAFLTVNAFTDTAPNQKFTRVDIHREDLKLIQHAPYDPEFWRNNPVVRRTPVEDSTIKSFEQQGVMGNMTISDL